MLVSYEIFMDYGSKHNRLFYYELVRIVQVETRLSISVPLQVFVFRANFEDK